MLSAILLLMVNAGLAVITDARRAVSRGKGAMGLRAGSAAGPASSSVPAASVADEDDDESDDCVGVTCSQSLGRGPRRGVLS